MRKAIIAGATGLTGRHCLRLLLENPEYDSVIAVVRKKADIEHPKLLQLIVDFDDLKNELKDISVDDVFCCLGTTMSKAGSKEAFLKVDHDYPLMLAEVMRKNSAQTFNLISALGADTTSFFFYNRVKGLIEEAVKQLDYSKINILRPSLLDGDRMESRPGERLAILISRFLDPIITSFASKMQAIKIEEVAHVLVHLALNGKPGVNVIESNEINRIYKTLKK
jgi:uncharacterized protein YbjT (DUF2867 family)